MITMTDEMNSENAADVTPPATEAHEEALDPKPAPRRRGRPKGSRNKALKNRDVEISRGGWVIVNGRWVPKGR